MALLPHVVAYVAVGVFILAVIARVLMWSRMPMHVRWELYPVAHEAERAHYGGSYLEEVDWWKKPRHASLMGELKVMVPEILFLVALREHNPKLWVRSFPFHFGLYLVIGCTALMMGGSILAAVAPEAMSGGLGTLFRYGVLASGYAGLVLGIIGAIGLLHRRLTDPALADYTAPADLFNLMLFIAVFATALVHAVAFDPRFIGAMAFTYSLVTFAPAAVTPAAFTTVTVLGLSLLVAYIPLTHMSHFIGKYFAYHAIRWNDTPNLRGGNQEQTIGKLLQQPVSWAAPHIDGKGQKTWADVATEEVKR